MNLDIRLPVEQLNQPIRACLTGETGEEITLELEAVDRRGRAIRCRTLITPFRGTEDQIVGAMLLLDTVQEPVGEGASLPE